MNFLNPLLRRIYKITNIENRKIYIGKTKRFLLKRLSEHLRQKTNIHFDNAIKKYGKDKFIIEEIDRCYNPKESIEKEKYWIEVLEARNPQIG